MSSSSCSAIEFALEQITYLLSSHPFVKTIIFVQNADQIFPFSSSSIRPTIPFLSSSCPLSLPFPSFGVSNTSLGEGNGNPLQYSCLENPMDRGAWQATVYGIAKSQTRLRDLVSYKLPPGGRTSPLLDLRNEVLLAYSYIRSFTNWFCLFLQYKELSNRGHMARVCALTRFSHVQLFATLWT